eukprot:TRINITY_DN29071_c0_g1_i1.p1 TRINITY_DN29071_c0_g1~~TRINITY_DN29071_c0_g1_i1.p1  ORF type:complete len:108 (+),score=23.84 TRINITY_DN29071_c0_g1_i1:817-1140(+)
MHSSPAVAASSMHNYNCDGPAQDVRLIHAQLWTRLRTPLLYLRVFSGINRKLQLKPHAWVTPEGATTERATELELILKWGGELTKLGERQAMELGDNFRRCVGFDCT